MRAFSKIIYWGALLLLVCFVIVPVIERFTQLEFTNDFRDRFEDLRFFVLPIAILCTLFGTIKAKDAYEIKTGKIILTICVALFCVGVLFVTVFSGMCQWSDGKIIFEDRNDKTTKIILRDFGCGATDSDLPVYKLVKVKAITPFLNRVTNVDTTKIDRELWQRVVEKE